MQFEHQRIKQFIVGMLLLASCAVSVAAQEPGRTAEVATMSSSTENWRHIYRDASPMIGPSDKGPHDEFLDVNYLEVKGEWALIHVKTIRDDPSTEYHGKLILTTIAISCNRIKFGFSYIGDFYDAEGRMPMRETALTFAELDQFAIGHAPAAGSPGVVIPPQNERG